MSTDPFNEATSVSAALPEVPPTHRFNIFMFGKLLFYSNAKSCRVEEYANFCIGKGREEVNGTLRAQMFVRLADEVGNAIRINNSNSTVVTPTNHQQPCLQ